MYISRRRFLRTASAFGGGLTLAGGSSLALEPGAKRSSSEVVLPEGGAPEPLQFPHFPDRLHAFVWRNWSLVPTERLAKVVGAQPTGIRRMGRAMGLSEPPAISREQQARSYITTIKRNWHLLNYSQLLELLGWTREQLAYTLREDDFLFIKLGSLKPHCKPLRFHLPDEAARRREREIAGILNHEFHGEASKAEDAPFAFVSRLSRPSESRAGERSASKRLKFCYSYFALYGDPLMPSVADPYPESYLERLSRMGVNGIWLQAVLSKLWPLPWEPSLSARHEVRLANLRALVAKAGKYGMRVFLYLNEPRAMPVEFFAGHPELKGVVEGGHAALCTSVAAVQDYLVESVAGICRAAPGLGGFFSITASENLTNCWSHGGGGACPRCKNRPAAQVIAEVNRLFARGIRRAGTDAELIAWDWGWNDAWANDAIGLLPREAALMSVSEWGIPIERGGVKSEVGEYCMSVVGPGARAKAHWQAARERGLKTIAKIQADNTWELAAVPYLPVVGNVARHAENLAAAKVDGIMLSWTLGGCPAPNLEVVSEALECGSADEAMSRVAERRFGAVLGRAMVKAWRRFSEAFDQYPFHVGVLYSAPQQLGPANLLFAEPTRYHASMTGFPYDDLDAWRAIYPATVFIQQFDAVADGFSATLDELKTGAAAALASATPEQRRAFGGDCGLAEAATIHFRSTANQARFVLARRALAAAQGPEEALQQKAALRKILQDEIALAQRLCHLQSRDSRIGFEASNQYFYLPIDLAEKVLNCRDLLARLG
jgi:hypothetical protein